MRLHNSNTATSLPPFPATRVQSALATRLETAPRCTLATSYLHLTTPVCEIGDFSSLFNVALLAFEGAYQALLACLAANNCTNGVFPTSGSADNEGYYLNTCAVTNCALQAHTARFFFPSSACPLPHPFIPPFTTPPPTSPPPSPTTSVVVDSTHFSSSSHILSLSL